LFLAAPCPKISSAAFLATLRETGPQNMRLTILYLMSTKISKYEKLEYMILNKQFQKMINKYYLINKLFL